MYQIRRKMIVYISRLLFPAHDGNMSTTKGQTPGKKETDMTRKAQTYLTRIKAAGSIYDLQGVEIAFKQDSTLGWDDISRLCKAADEKRYTLTNSEVAAANNTAVHVFTFLIFLCSFLVIVTTCAFLSFPSPPGKDKRTEDQYGRRERPFQNDRHRRGSAHAQ